MTGPCSRTQNESDSGDWILRRLSWICKGRALWLVPYEKQVCGSPRVSLCNTNIYITYQAWTHQKQYVMSIIVRLSVTIETKKVAIEMDWLVVRVCGMGHVCTDHVGQRHGLLKGSQVVRRWSQASQNQLGKVRLGSLSALRAHLRINPEFKNI